MSMVSAEDSHGPERRPVEVCVPNDTPGKRLFLAIDLETGEQGFVVSSWIRRRKPGAGNARAIARRMLRWPGVD